MSKDLHERIIAKYPTHMNQDLITTWDSDDSRWLTWNSHESRLITTHDLQDLKFINNLKLSWITTHQPDTHKSNLKLAEAGQQTKT